MIPIPKPGCRISRYRIVGPLGAGGMGEVYRARNETLDRDVALKLLPPDLVRNEERLRRFVLEAKSASSLNHPNIVHIYEIGQKRLLLAVGKGLWSAASDGGDARLLTEFGAGDIFAMRWARDGQRVIFTYGSTVSDAVLIRGFR